MNKKILIAAVFPLLAACSNVELQETACSDVDLQELTIEPQDDVFNLEISYQGQVYDVPCSLDEEGNLVYLDTKFKELYDKELSQYPNLVTLDCGNNKVAYFRSFEDMLQQKGYNLLETNEGVEPRALTDLAGRVTLWDDTGFKDRSVTVDVDYLQYYACPHLKPAYDFNDKTSALKVWSYIPENTTITFNGKTYNSDDLRVVFLGYEDDNYRGKVLCCIPDNNGVAHEHARLKDIGWNDKITAVVFRIIENGMYTPHE